jgi:outer membrane protein insertion porin family
MSRARRILLGALALAPFFLAFGVFPQEPLRRMVERRLQSAVGPGSRLVHLHVVPLLLRVELGDIQLRAPGFSLQVPFARAALSPAALLRGAPILRHLELDSPRLELRPSPSPSEAPPETLKRLRIAELAVRDALIRWEDPARAVAAEVVGLSARGAVGAGRLEIEARELAWRGAQRLDLGPATASLATSPSLDATLESLTLRAGTSRLSARGTLSRSLAFHTDLTVEGQLDLIDLGRRLGVPSLSGSAAVAGRVQGEVADLRLAGRVAGDLEWDGWKAERAEIEVSHEGARSFTEARVTARVLAGRVEGTARIDGARTKGRVQAFGLDLAPLTATAAGHARVRADVDVAWDGPIDGSLQSEVHVTAEGRTPQGTGTVRAEARGSVDPRDRSVDLAWTAALSADPAKDAAATAGGRVEATLGGHFATRGGRLAADVVARGLDLAALVPGVHGRGDLDITASGPLGRPTLSVRASVDGLGWLKTPLGPLRARLDGDLQRAHLGVDLPDLKVKAEGEMLGHPRRLHGMLRLDESPLGPFFPLLTSESEALLSGRATGAVAYDFALDRPSEGTLTADVALLEVERGGRSLRARPFRASLRGGRFLIDDLRVEGPGVRLTARAEAGLASGAPIDLRSQLVADLASLPLPEGWSAAGTADGEVAIRGSRAQPVVDGVVRARDVALHGPSLPEIRLDEAELALERDRARISTFKARIGGGTATVSGVLPFASAWTALRKGTLAPSDAARLAVRWDGLSVDPIGGPLAGELTLEGGLASLREPRAVLSLPDTRLRIEGQPLELLSTSLNLENGRVTAAALTLRSGSGDLVVTGSADLVESAVDLRGRGSLDLRTLSPLLAEAALGGAADVDLAVTGPLGALRTRGSVHVRDGSLRLRMLPEALTGMTGTLEFDGAQASVKATGQMGGGSVELGGEALVSGTSVSDVQLVLTGRGLALRYPPGLRSRLDADLVLTGRPGAFTLDGDVEVQRGLYEIDVALEEALKAPVVAASESERLRSVGLDIRVRLPRPILVRSSLGEVEATGRITVHGDLQEPLPFGQLEVRPGGKVYLQGRELAVRDGALTYSGNWNPALGLNAEIVIPAVGYTDYRVRVSAGGSLEQPSLSFSSEPPLSQPEIVSLVATGRLGGALADTGAWLVGGQAGALLAGRLTRRVAQTFGLDEITVRPDLVARETDPSARFTFGKNLGRRLGLVYSVGLGGPETRFVQVEGRPGYDLTLKAQRTDDGSYTYGVGQRFHWGEARHDAESGDRVPLREVRFEGDPVDEAVREAVRLSVGSRASEWTVQDEAERIRDRLRDREHLDAEVAARLDDGVAIFTVHPGPAYSWRVEGIADPPDLGPIIRRALFAEEALDRGRERLLRDLRDRGYLRAEVAATVQGEGGHRALLFSARTGQRYSVVSVRFPGASTLSDGVLLGAAGGAAGLLEDPVAAVSAIRATYSQRHFLGTLVHEPQVEEAAGRLQIVVPIEEGAPARLASVRFEGTSLSEDVLRSAAGVETGGRFSDDAAAQAVAAVRNLYLSRGYPSVRVRPRLVAEGTDLALVLQVSEGERREIEEITLSGNTRTRDGLVRRALGLQPGDPLDPRRLAAAEQRLLGLGVFSRAAIVPQPRSPSSLEVQLEEGPNLTGAYDLRWDDEEGASALVEGEARNVLGTGLALGARYRFGRDIRETRGSLHVPAAFGWGDLTGSVFRLEQDFPTEDFVITRLQRGFQLQQSLHLASRLDLLAGYRFRRNTTLAPGLPAEPIDVAGLDLSLLHNTRDDLLDPRRGDFLSVNVELAPSALGSDAPFTKVYAQAVLARPIGEASLTWAQSYRLGLAWGFGGEPVISFERFYAGGADSLRGFGTNEVGPRGPLGDVTGGEAVVILNQELRYRHRSGLGGAVFYDGGNVFASVHDMSLRLRHTLGAGLRWASPVGLLRVDLGFPLARQEGEKAYRLFVGLGQAF